MSENTYNLIKSKLNKSEELSDMIRAIEILNNISQMNISTKSLESDTDDETKLKFAFFIDFLAKFIEEEAEKLNTDYINPLIENIRNKAQDIAFELKEKSGGKK